MTSIPPSKAWMKERSPCPKYMEGVELFMKFAKDHSGNVDWYLCPCINCRNVGGGKTYKVVKEHLICDGIMTSYTTWYCHGEPIIDVEPNQERCSASSSGKTHEEQPRMLDLVNDAFRRVLPESLDACMNELGSHGDTHTERGEDNNSKNNSREDIKAKKLRDDVTQPRYPSCGVEETKLSVIVELVGLKSTHNWSNNSFDELLKTLKSVLPSVFSTMASRQAEGGSGFQQAEGGSGSRQTNGENGYGQSAGEPRQKIFVLFDEDGRPVGDKAAEYSSHLGEYSRAHASIAHHRWKNVSDDDKTLIWKRIYEEYDLSGTTKEKVMAKANEYWRKYKSSSLRKVYDKYRTDEERKRHCPGAIRKEDWEKFVDNESTEAAKSCRVNGKLSRQAAIARQRSGRKGSARIAHE
ncbi:hypothetical protein IFM89_023677 [Coptis chinensis]|uniref:Transposase-associated domain-containing protein n=1 Tax=Coptis chinensis TaxID=261450 RepID=A0A835GYT3_9MAGN|nr:hypothetical protein IFM89_023677 [Coptis chinensis]